MRVFEPQLFFLIQHARHPDVHNCRDFEGNMTKDSDVFKFRQNKDPDRRESWTLIVLKGHCFLY